MDRLHYSGSAVSDLDLNQENIQGIFTNLTLLAMMLSSVTQNKPFPTTKPYACPEYDYIIVGAGPGGSVMASRLSENSCITVLLLEAGDATPVLTEVPAFARFFLNTRVDWAYQTETQKYAAFGLHENKVNWNSGKGLGGGSIINSMMYVRGHKGIYDQWEAEGATGWGYENVKQYFLKLEDNKNIAELDQGYHQEGGPQTVERVNYTSEIKYPAMEALTELGYKEVDVNGRQQTGIYNIQGLLRNQQRCSAAKAYLVPAENRTNLDIVKGAFVKKIIIENGRAVGVQYDHNLLELVVRAKKEVIVSSGSVRTAQLLMLSGIGPREELNKFNIKVNADLPVGKNLQDHCSSGLFYLVNNTIQNVVLKIVNPVNILDYIVNRHGPLTAPTQISVIAFSSGLNGSSVTTDIPRQEIYFIEYNTLDAELNSNLKEGIFEKYYAPYLLEPVYLCLSTLMRPRSRGQITLKSTNPYDHPLINPNYYQDENDLRDVVEGLKMCNHIARSQPMQNVQATPIPMAFPGCEEEFESNETEYLTCYARHLTNSDYHPVGVARMGQCNDSRSVVDPQLRVIGVQGLRVVNAAVMPIIPTGNTNVPTLMVAEKAYDMMKDEVKCSGTVTGTGEIKLL